MNVLADAATAFVFTYTFLCGAFGDPVMELTAAIAIVWS